MHILSNILSSKSFHICRLNLKRYVLHMIAFAFFLIPAQGLVIQAQLKYFFFDSCKKIQMVVMN